MAKRVSIINFKGGVGKTSVALHLACGLARYERVENRVLNVLMIDVDHQSSLSINVLGGTHWEEAVKNHLTINEVFRSFTERGVSMPGDEIVHRAPYGKGYPTLDLVPAALELDDTEIDLGATSYSDPVHPNWPKLTLLSDWLERTGLDAHYDYIIFDCPPATKLVSRNAIACSHGYILPLIPDAVSSRGMPHLVRLLENKVTRNLRSYVGEATRRGYHVPTTLCTDTKLAAIVIYMIVVAGNAASGYTDEHTTSLHNLTTGAYATSVVEPYIPSGEGVRFALGRGRPVYDFPYVGNITRRDFIGKFKRLTSQLRSRVDAL